MWSLPAAVGLLTTLVALSTAQLPFSPVFHLSQYNTVEGGQQAIHLSAPILARPQIPPFTGSIEVEIAAEDLPRSDTRQNAQFGIDYHLDAQNSSSRTFTVVFQSKQANSSEQVILLSDDQIFEGTEYFHLRIVDARFSGQAAALFRAQDGLNNTIADVNIADDDFVRVNWTISQTINVTEGDGVEVRLSGEVFGMYANPIAVGVVCTASTDVEPAFPGIDFGFTGRGRLNFRDVETLQSFSSDQVVIPIINDDIAEPCEYFVCAQGTGVDSVQAIEPNLVTIKICDDDELIVRWATDLYEFTESQIATVELVTDSKFEASRVSIQGFPKQIPNGHPNHFPSLVVPGRVLSGFVFDANIEQAVSDKFLERVFGNAQVTQSGRTDVVNTINDFVFTPASKSAFENFTIVDDTVLEFDELLIAEFNFGPEIATDWNAKKGEPSIAFILITDDDDVEVNFNEPSYTAVESDGEVSISLHITGQFYVPVWVIVEINDGTASDPEDYSSATRYNVTIRQTAFTDGDDPAPTALSSPMLINITDDDIFEGAEYFQARIVETSDRFRVRIGQDTVNVTINDSVTVRYEEELYSVEEEAGYVTLALVLEGDTAIPVTVSVNTLDLLNSSVRDAATAQVDYIPKGPFNITFPPGSRRQLYNVTIVDDAIPENSEFFNADVSLARPEDASRVVIGSPKQPLIEILDIDIAGVYFDPDVYIEPEGYTVTLVLKTNVTVNKRFGVLVNTVDDSANSPADYQGGEMRAIFEIGSSMATVQYSTVNDSIHEGIESFTAELTVQQEMQEMGIFPGMPDTARVHITDDEVLICMLVRTMHVVAENMGPLEVMVMCSHPSKHPFTLVVRSSDGTAVEGEDYTGTEFQVNFPSGVTKASFSIPIVDDSVFEPDEYFSFTLEIPQAAQDIGVTRGNPYMANVTIKNDEHCVTKTCLNGGTQDPNTCDCVCPPEYTGEFCETNIPSRPGGCPAEEDKVWKIHWPAAAPDSIQSVACPGERGTSGLDLAHRNCLDGGMWGSVVVTECESVAVSAVRMEIEEFVSLNGTLTDDARRVLQNISRDLSAALKLQGKEKKPILPQDLKTVAKFLKVVADLAENNDLIKEETNRYQEVFADVLSELLDERNTPAFEAITQKSFSADPAEKKISPAISILQSTERVANVIVSTSFKNKNSFTISRPNLAIHRQRFSFNSLQTGVVFPGPGVTLPSFRKLENLPQIRLPRAFLSAARGVEMTSGNGTVEVVNVVMDNMENYLPTDVVEQDEEMEGEVEDTLPASHVLSSQIPGYDGREVDTKEKVELIFPVNENAQALPVPSGRVKRFRCAFFNFSGGTNQTGGWSYRGVKTEIINNTHIRCNASHLTTFVVLVSIIPAVRDPPALDYITYIGCSISFLCLLASIIFFLSLRKELIQKLHNFVHLNLCIALSLGLLLFLTGIQTATANIYACKVVTALLHYFFLATFTWTLCEAILIYILLVKVFGANDKKWIYLYLALGWALPIPVVVITGGARHDYYLIRSSLNQSHPHYENIKACWLPNEKGVIFAFIGPMVAIIVVNAVLLTISLVSLAKSECLRTSEIKSTWDEKRQKYMEVGKHLVKATIILAPLMGFTWIIGLFAVGEEGRVFAYLFVFANVFQGLFIFVLHVVRHEKVYGKNKDKLPKFRKQMTLITRRGTAAGGTPSSMSYQSDSKKNNSCAVVSEAITELREKEKEEDAGSIKEGGHLEIELNIIDKKVEDQKNTRV